MLKTFLKIAAAMVIAVIIFWYLIIRLIFGVGHAVVNETKKSYNTPDTTIVTKNGKSDTTIVKKSMPSILK